MATDPQRKVSIIMGMRDSGKTTFVKNIIRLYNPDYRVLIVDTTPDHPKYNGVQLITPAMIPYWKKGVKRIMVDEDSVGAVTEHIRQLRYSLIIYEDGGKYLYETVPVPGSVKKLCLDSKQHFNDLLFLYHGFGDVPKKLFRYANFLTIFKTMEDIKSYKGKIPNFQHVYRVWQQVMSDPSQYKNITIPQF